MNTTGDFHLPLCPRCGQYEHGSLSCVGSALQRSEQQREPFEDEPAQNEQPGPNKTFAQSLAELRVALEAKTCEGHPDPAFAPLLVLLRDKSPCLLGWWHSSYCDCRGTGFITRIDYWRHQPDGALEGTLLKALAGFNPYNDELLPLLSYLGNLICYQADTRQKAVEAVLKWVKGN